jgi:hypothetical protein
MVEFIRLNTLALALISTVTYAALIVAYCAWMVLLIEINR